MVHAHAAHAAPRNPYLTPWSWFAFAAFPVLLVVGFVLGNSLVGDPNDPATPHGWDYAARVIALWAVLEVVPVIGILVGVRAGRHHEPGARAAIIANAAVVVFFVGMTLIGGLIDAFK